MDGIIFTGLQAFKTYDCAGSRFVKLGSSQDVLRFTSKHAKAAPGDAPFDGLHFATGPLTPRAAAALEGFLLGPARSINLTGLIMDSPEQLLGSSLGLATAFAGLTGLTRLELKGVGQHSRSLLRALHAPLSSVNLAMVPLEEDVDEDDEDWEAAGRNAMMLLENFEDTLETVVCEGTRAQCADDEDFPQVYHQVEQIYMERVELPTTTDYVHAFPHIARLTISTATEAFVKLLENGTLQQELHECRRFNISEQRVCGSWQTLDLCDTTVGTLYALGLQCHVHFLHIRPDIVGTEDMLGRVLMDTTPTLLVLHDFSLGMLSGPGFASLMQGPAMRSIKTLEITLVLDEHSGKDTMAIGAAFDAVIHALKPLQIQSLGLGLLCECKDPAGQVALLPAATFLQELKVDALASCLRTAVRSRPNVVIRVDVPNASAAAAAGDEHKIAELVTYRMAEIYGLLPGIAARRVGAEDF